MMEHKLLPPSPHVYLRPSLTTLKHARHSRARLHAASSQDQEVDASSQGQSTVCAKCGVPTKEIPWGCNQDGRVAGGIGAFVGFDWWPIKAYKPCPKAAKAGVLYTRKGQITDEMLFGRRREQHQK